MRELQGYKLRERIYESPTTIVLHARRTADDHGVVVKMPNGEYPSLEELARYARELGILKRIGGHGVPVVHALERYGNAPALVMDEPDGAQSLARWLASRALGVGELLPVFVRMADVLGVVHAHGIVHKDVNPNNVLVNPDTREVTLIDFGIASLLPGAEQIIESAQSLEGTLPYMAPEQTGRMNRSVDYRADLYSLGVTFYEMLTRALPFESTDRMELVHAHLAKRPVAPHERNPAVPPMLSFIVMKLLEKPAEARYQGAVGLRRDLEECARRLASNDSAAFELGRRDISKTFRIPEKLYGLENELRTVLDVFDHVAGGVAARSEVLWVMGSSGMGKSSLVREIQRPVTERRGYFVRGKHDQFKRNIPYSAIIQALRDLVRQVLSESAEQLARWGAALHAALGANAAVVTAVLPELELIIGTPTAIVELGAIEAQNRFDKTFEAFIGAFAKPEHPLALFLDDVQWADVPSLELLERLMGGETTRNMLLVLAYRTSEVDEAHPLRTLSRTLAASGVSSHAIELAPLGETHIEELVSDTLHCGREDARPLARLILGKTLGNPFFVHQFLRSLHAQHLIAFDDERAAWKWDVQEIRDQGATDNVVDLLVTRLRALPEATTRVLTLAACIGNVFDLRTLAVVGEKGPTATARDLWEAIRGGFVVPVGKSYEQFHPVDDAPSGERDDSFEEARKARYRFLHDRVQQAAYSLIEEPARKRLHKKIGGLLLAGARDDEAADQIFVLLDHLDAAIDLVSGDAERLELATLNHTGAKRAKASTAFAPAIRYASIACTLLGESAWNEHYALGFELHRELIELEYLTGNVARSNALYDVAWARARTKVDRAVLCRIRANFQTLEHDFPKTLATCQEGLALLGIHLPERPSRLTVLRTIITARARLWGRTDEDLATAPEATAPEVTLASDLMEVVCPAAIQTDDLNLFAATVMTNVALCAKHGVTPALTTAYIAYGAVLSAAFNDHAALVRFGNLGLRLSERLGNVGFAARVPLLYAQFVDSWVSHIEVAVTRLTGAIDRLMDLGDYTTASYAMTVRGIARFAAGHPIQEMIDSAPAAEAFFRKSRDVGMHLIYSVMVEGARKAACENDDYSRFVDPRFGTDDEPLVTSKIVTAGVVIVKTLFRFLAGRIDEAIETDLESFRAITAGTNYEPILYYYQALILAEAFPRGDTATQKKWLGILRRNERMIRRWAVACPENYLQCAQLVAAERARVAGDAKGALALYDAAIASATKQGFVHHQALANEGAAKLCLAMGRPQFAKVYMMDARYCYERWGVKRRVQLLDETYPELLAAALPAAVGSIGMISSAKATTTSGSVSSGALDMTTVLKASQALSGEVVLDRLLRRLMKIVIENAGAQKGVLLEEREGELRVQAAGLLEGDDVTVLDATSAEAAGCPAVAHYVARTREALVLHDATREGMFQSDPYVVARQVRSILCVPVLQQARLTGVLYLENALVAGAFTPARVEVLHLLASQIAISIENATLYGELEARVVDRTRELSAANKSLQQLFDHMRQAIIAFGSDGVVTGAYSKEAARVFGGEGLEAARVEDLLFASAPAHGAEAMAFNEWLSVVFEVTPEALEELAALAPPEVVLHEGTPEELHLALEFRPIVSEGRVSRVMLLATDQTEKRHLERQVQAKEAEHARSLAAMRRLLSSGTDAFVSFLHTSEERLARFDARLAALASRDARPAEIEQLFRQAHTLRSEAHAFELSNLEQASARLEGLLEARRQEARDAGRVPPGPWRSELRAGVARARAELALLQETLVEASPSGGAVLRRITVSRSDLERLDALAARRADPVGQVVSRLLARPLGESTARFLEGVPVWAEAMGKRARLEVVGREVRVPRKLAQCLTGVLTHLVRNGLAHGIEAPDVRARAGKDPAGLLQIACADDGRGAVLVVEDDGRGIDREALRRRAETLGVDVPDGGELALIFHSGLSTADTVDAIAGRGVGMAAVLADLEAAGYALDVSSERGKGTRFVMRPKS